jgi:hypothetical protein
MDTAAIFINGMVTAGCVVIAGFFARFWHRTRDSLFLIFAAAFCLMALNHALAALLGLPTEDRSGLYLLRAAAFALIIIGVLMKNLSAGAAEK